MDLSTNLMLIALLILLSAFFSMAEISLAAANRIRLSTLRDEGEIRAGQVLKLQQQPGNFFTVAQIGLNAVAILAGTLGDGAFSPHILTLLERLGVDPRFTGALSFLLSFLLVTVLFILFADLVPKRLAMVMPESIAMRVVKPMNICIRLLKPVVFVFDRLSGLLFKLLRFPLARSDEVTTDEIYAMVEAGAKAGVLQHQEHHLIENVFELEMRTVGSAMTAREDIVFFTLNEGEDSLRRKIAEHPHAKFPVCDGQIDKIIGYVDSKDLLLRLLRGQSISLREQSNLRNPLVIPSTLTLSEALERFRVAREDFALIINEYALVVGLITLNDVIAMLMGDLVAESQDEQIVCRDDNSWLMDGVTQIEDVKRVLGIAQFPDEENYETVAGFMMYRLKKVPKLTDSVEYDGFKFEVVDIDNFRIDQLLVSRLTGEAGEPVD